MIVYDGQLYVSTDSKKGSTIGLSSERSARRERSQPAWPTAETDPSEPGSPRPARSPSPGAEYQRKWSQCRSTDQSDPEQLFLRQRGHPLYRRYRNAKKIGDQLDRRRRPPKGRSTGDLEARLYAGRGTQSGRKPAPHTRGPPVSMALPAKVTATAWGVELFATNTRSAISIRHISMA